MTKYRKILNTAGMLAVSAVAVSALGAPAAASADTGVVMYGECSAAQEGTRVSTADGSVLECVQADAGYNWQDPASDDN